MSDDLRFALRQMRKSPAFSITVALTLALGIGASTAIFSVVDAVLLRPLPYAEPDRLVRLYETKAEEARGSLSGPNFLDLRAQGRVLSAMAAYRQWSVALTGQGQAARLDAALVSPSFFDVLGVPPLHGRTFVDAGRGGSFLPIVISHDAACVPRC